MIALLATVAIVIVPVWLSPEPAVPPAIPPAAPGRGGSVLRDRRAGNYPIKSLGAVDRETFLASFSRQAGARLVPCLADAGEVTGRVAFVARLGQRGRLTEVRALRSLGGADACARGAIAAMSFASLRIPVETVEIEWIFEW